jgi:hypothetical protein
MSHAQMITEIGEMCDERDLFWFVSPGVILRRGTPGFPDLVITGPGAILWREVKAGRDIIRRAQRDWGYALAHHRADYGVWRQADLDSGRVAVQLDRAAALRLRLPGTRTRTRRGGGSGSGSRNQNPGPVLVPKGARTRTGRRGV